MGWAGADYTTGLLMGGRRVYPPQVLVGVDKDPSDWEARTINRRFTKRRRPDINSDFEV